MSVIETKYSDFKKRQTKRNRAVYVLVFFVIVSTSLLVYSFIEFRPLYYIGTIIFGVGILAWFLIVITRSWFPEMVETKIFVNFYEAYKRLEACSAKDERAQLDLEKAHQEAKTATLILKRYALKLSSESSSRLIRTEIAERYRELASNLETRILPRIIKKIDVEEIKGILCALSFSFSEVYTTLHVSDIVTRNKELKKYDPIESEEPISEFRTILARRSTRILLSFIGSLIFIIIVYWLYSIFANTDFIEELKVFSNFQTFLFGVSAVGGIIYGIISKKT